MSDAFLPVRQRESRFELLRIVSQYYIVLYHILLMFIYPSTGSVVFKALQLPLHTGVIIFVLISGYFGIRPTSKGLFKLLSIFLVYNFSEFVYNLVTADGMRALVKSSLFLSNSHFWFVKTYLFLYLFSPILNTWKENASQRRMLYSLIVLGFVSIYMGTTGGDISMVTGKNLVNFSFLYLLGWQIRQSKPCWERFRPQWLLFAYLTYNAIVFLGYFFFSQSQIGSVIWLLNFPYSSPGLLLNSILLFILFGTFTIQSERINWLAKSSFAVYLIHANRPYIIGAIGYVSLWMKDHLNSTLVLLLFCAFFAVAVVAASITIDKILTPIWRMADRLGNKIYNYLGV